MCYSGKQQHSLFFKTEFENSPIVFDGNILDNQWLEVFNQENNTYLNHEKSLWRLRICSPSNQENKHFIYLTLHHAVADGISADIFLDKIFSEYTENESVDLEKTFDILPAAEDILSSPFTQSWEHFRQTFSDALALEKHQSSEIKQFCPIEERSTKTEVLSIENEALAIIENYCEKAGYSVNSFLSTALVKAYNTALLVFGGVSNTLSFHTTFSLRRLMGLDTNGFGCYMSILPMTFSLEEQNKSIDDFAKVHHKKVTKSILMFSKQPVSYDSNVLKKQSESFSTMKTFHSDIMFTYGESTIKSSYGDLNIELICPTANRSVGNLALTAHVLKHNNTLDISINCTVPNQEAEFVDQVLNYLKENLTKEKLLCLCKELPKNEREVTNG